MQEELRKIPAVGDAVHWPEFAEILRTHPRQLVIRAIAGCAENLRQEILQDHDVDTSKESFVQSVLSTMKVFETSRLRRVINATGIIVHTNLGRSVLAKEAVAAVAEMASSYSSLEYDLSSRVRGSRHTLVSDLLCELTGASAAIVVNNNAAAVLLCLNTLAEGRQVVVSRGELVEIGGSFRVPDIMSKSGCELVEVGTTNKTHPRDYRNAVTGDTALFLKVHTSNYRIMGFSNSVPGRELVRIGEEFSIPVMEDLGSGFLVDPSLLNLRDEPTVRETVKNGLSVVTFSGDKLLGGPQAGIILSEPVLIKKIASNPLARVVRCDKMTLAALEATLRIYRDPDKIIRKIPTLKMASASLKTLREKSRRLALKIKERVGNRAQINLATTNALVGGGALPMMDLPSAAVSIRPSEMSVTQLDIALHDRDIPIIGRIESDQYIIDVRTLLDGETKIVQNTVSKVLTEEIGK